MSRQRYWIAAADLASVNTKPECVQALRSFLDNLATFV
jgi:hypothetical protein